MGVHSHANSPLRKATSSSYLRNDDAVRRVGSPLKRMSTPGGGETTRDERRRQTGRF